MPNQRVILHEQKLRHIADGSRLAITAMANARFNTPVCPTCAASRYGLFLSLPGVKTPPATLGR